ncbi:MAG: 3-hydroxyacyl-ACP dehydratase FabZ [Pseudomonadota bacterium]|nr:3-hydroxyacyl-ACP dehydratase FabZ [Pseudomonadota bacterium]
MSTALQFPIDVPRINALLPHRYPFLLVDRVTELEPNKRVLAYKNVSANEPFFQGHFPGQPVMPGVLVIEALAQAGGLLTRLSQIALAAEAEGGDASADGDKLYYLVKVDCAKFTRMVAPGDRLDLEVTLKRTIRNMALYSGIARVDGKQVACADILCAEVDA